jgi:ligand-binding SRPBCC domain-containing protein
MQEGTLIDYQLRLYGFPLKWKSEISTWQPPDFFVDHQLRGPYRSWVHEHRFEAGDGGTWVRDRVLYRIWGGRLFHGWVKRDLNRIFDFREEQMRTLFGPADH